MKVDQIIVLKETREEEARVALTPSAVAALVAKHYSVIVESEAGQLAGFTDEEYVIAGAKLFKLSDGLLPYSLLLRVKRPNKSREILENALFSRGAIMMGFLDPFDVGYENHMQKWHDLGVVTISLELLDLTADDPKNAQAAMSRFAGQLALEDALQRYQGALPKRVTVLGTGPAGLSAAFAAMNLQLPVQLFGRQERHRQTVEAAGIHYYVLPVTEQAAFIREHLKNETIIIGAARNIGEKTPLLIDEASLAVLPEKAVLVDLSTGEGGCIAKSREDAVIMTDRSISIVNVSGYPKAKPQAASEAFAQCMVNLLIEIVDPKKGLNFESKLLKDILNKLPA